MSWLSGNRGTGRKYSRRRVLKGGALGAAGIAGAALIGCSDDEAAQESVSETPKSGGTLRIATAQDLSSLEPHLLAANHRNTTYPIWNTLTKYDSKLQPQGQLVKSWEQTDGGLKHVLHLREGVTWHTGRAFVSDDIKLNLDRVKDPALPFAQFRVSAQWFTVTLPDTKTIVLTSDKPRPGTFDFFELLRMPDPVTMQGPDSKTKAVGTGPWKFDEWRQGVHLKLSKNPTYWDTSKPYLDGITWGVELQQETAVAQLESGAIDAILNPSLTSFARFRDSANTQVFVHPSIGANYTMGFHTKVAPWTDKRFRQAFNWAYDRKRFAELILKGIVGPVSLPWPKASLAYEESKNQHYNLDLKKTVDLIKAAGGSDLKTNVILHNGRPELVEFMPVWQADLKTAGVDMQIRVMETAAWQDAANNLKYDGLYAVGSSYAGLGSPSSMFALSQNVWSGAGKNNTGFTNARWEELVALASVELDSTKAKRLYSELNDILLDESHIVVTAPEANRLALAKSVRNPTVVMTDSFEFHESWLA